MSLDVKQCPGCGHDTEVVDTRPVEKLGMDIVRRRRACVECGHRYSTFEVHETFFKGCAA